MSWNQLPEAEVHDYLEDILRSFAVDPLFCDLKSGDKKLAQKAYVAGQIDFLFFRDEIDEDFHFNLLQAYCT